jgi:hypothetical protein
MAYLYSKQQIEWGAGASLGTLPEVILPSAIFEEDMDRQSDSEILSKFPLTRAEVDLLCQKRIEDRKVSDDALLRFIQRSSLGSLIEEQTGGGLGKRIQRGACLDRVKNENRALRAALREPPDERLMKELGFAVSNFPENPWIAMAASQALRGSVISAFHICAEMCREEGEMVWENLDVVHGDLWIDIYCKTWHSNS